MTEAATTIATSWGRTLGTSVPAARIMRPTLCAASPPGRSRGDPATAVALDMTVPQVLLVIVRPIRRTGGAARAQDEPMATLPRVLAPIEVVGCAGGVSVAILFV